MNKEELAGVTSESESVRNSAGGLGTDGLSGSGHPQDPGTALRLHRIWLSPTPTAEYYRPRNVVRPWQVKPVTTQKIVYFAAPIPNAAGMRNPSARNLERKEGNSRARIRVRRSLLAYPAMAGDSPHFADVSALETPEDRRKAKNALKRNRRARR